VTPTIESEKVFGTSSTNNGITTSKKQPKRSQKQTTFASGREKKEFVDKITALLETPSKFRNDGGTVEGVVLRLDSEEWLLHRYKVVRPDFVSGCNDGGHWSRRPVDKQIVDFVFMQSYLDECYVFAQQEQHHDKESDRKDACLDTSDSGIKLTGSTLPAKEDGASKSTPKPPTGKAEQKRQSRERQLAEHNSQSRRRRVPRCVMLMGLPGSGKSTFSRRLCDALARDSSCTVVVANQDDLGRKQCIQVASRASSRRTRVILDRCNLLEAERKEWWNCMHSPPPGEVALVYFTADADTCTERVQQRTNHVTIAHGTGARIVQQLSRRVESPTEDERKNIFGNVYEVRTFQEANDLLRQWGVEDDFRAPSDGDGVDEKEAVIDL
jgi:predicted kinase